MADFYATEFVGVVDGTLAPPKRADARLVGYRPRGIRATKPAGQALAVNDRLYIGRKRAGESIADIKINVSASLSTTTIDIGTTADPDKYVDGATQTTADRPTSIGPIAVASAASPDADYEDLWLTVLTANIAGGTTLVVETTFRALN